MPTGTGATTLSFLPDVEVIMDPGLFSSLTEKNIGTLVSTVPDKGAGKVWQEKLSEVGLVPKFRVNFKGSLVVTAALTATTGHDWPYGFLQDFKVSANGQNDLWNCDGVDLHGLSFAKYPVFDEVVDDHPGTVGGGDVLAAGTYPLDLSWEVSPAMDDLTLVGSLFAQSATTNIQIRGRHADHADIFSAGAANATITGDWFIETTFFEIPVDAEGRLIVPDLSRLHGFNAVDFTYVGTGAKRIPLIRSAGQLVRLFVSAEKDKNARLSALPSAADANTVDAIRLEYGGNQRPLDFERAADLLRLNNRHYGGLVPYDRIVMDWIKENPVRDAFLLQGVTELHLVPTINSAVVVTNGVVRVAQETLF